MFIVSVLQSEKSNGSVYKAHSVDVIKASLEGIDDSVICRTNSTKEMHDSAMHALSVCEKDSLDRLAVLDVGEVSGEDFVFIPIGGKTSQVYVMNDNGNTVAKFD